jgi:hypothetical protein
MLKLKEYAIERYYRHAFANYFQQYLEKHGKDPESDSTQ